MRPLRILHVSPYFADAWAYGGIPRVTTTLTRALAQRGHDLTVCTTDACDASARLVHGNGHQRNAWTTPWTYTDTGVEVRVFPNVSNAAAYHLQGFLPIGLRAHLREQAGAFDVAHLHACRNLPGAIAAHYLTGARVPYVLAPNGTAPRLERRFLIKRAYDAVLGDRVQRAASRMIAVADAECQQLKALGVPDDRIRLIPNPVDLSEVADPVERGWFRRRNFLDERPIVLFLGKLTARKRLDVLLHAFARLDVGAQLVIAGNDMGAGNAARRLAAELGIQGRTRFTGLLKGRTRLEALADADVLVYPSQDEIFGLVPLESLLCGTPPIVADDCGCGEVIRRTGGGVVVRMGDTDALAHALSDVLRARGEWRRHAQIGAERVKALFAPDAVAAQIEDVYAEIVTMQKS